MGTAAIPAAAIAAAVEEARAFLRIEGTGEQVLLERLAETAILLGEAFTGSVLLARTCEDVISAAGGWRMLSAVPVTAIAGVTGLPVDGAPYLLPVGSYAVDIDGEGRGWVNVAGRVAVAYTAGLAATWQALPAPLAQGTVALIAHLFDDRTASAQPPAAVAALWRPFRRMHLQMERRA